MCGMNAEGSLKEVGSEEVERVDTFLNRQMMKDGSVTVKKQ